MRAVRVALYSVLGLAPLLPLADLQAAEPDTLADISSTSLAMPVGRPLVEILQAFNNLGRPVVYSSALVPRGLRVLAPVAGSTSQTGLDHQAQAWQQLAAVLGQHQLALTSKGQTHIVIAADDPGRPVEGRVIDARDGAAVPGANITLAGIAGRIFSDGRGHFSFPDSSSPNSITVSAAGYQDLTLVLAANRQQLVLRLQPAPGIETLVVTSSRRDFHVGNSPASQELVRTEIASVPTLGSDVLRAVNRLPGLSTVGLSARPRVQGGDEDEVLVLFDGIELLEPFHLRDFQSVISSLDARTIDSIRFHAGGFPAAYGNHLSGVMDITPERFEPGFGGEFAINPFTTGALLHGSAADSSIDWLLSGRRGNLDLIAREVNPELGTPRFHDAFARVGYSPADNSLVEFSVLNFEDAITLNEESNSTESIYRNIYAWLRIDRQQDQGSTSTRLSFGNIDHDRRATLAEDNFAHGQLLVQSSLQTLQLSHEANRRVSSSRSLAWGLDLGYTKARLRNTTRLTLAPLAAALGLATEVDRQLALDPTSLRIGPWLQLRQQLAGNFSVEAGLRLDSQRTAGNTEVQLSPRLSLRWDAGGNSRWFASAGRFYQPQGLHELELADGLASFNGPQRADHLLLATEYNLAERVRLRAGLFFKAMDKLTPRPENLYNELVILPEAGPDRILVQAEHARSYGLELSATGLSANSSWSLNYTLARAEETLAGRTQPRPWDQRHTINAEVQHDRGPWTLGAALTWHSGWPTSALPNAAGSQALDLRNRQRRRDFLSLDLRLAYTLEAAGTQLEIFAEVINATARDNVGGEEVGLEPDMPVTSTDEFLLPLVPSIGLVWTF